MRQLFRTQSQRRCGDNLNGQGDRGYQQHHSEGQGLDDGLFQDEVDEDRQTETGREDHQHDHDADQNLVVEVGDDDDDTMGGG